MKNFDNYGTGINMTIPAAVREAFATVDERQVKQIRIFVSATTKKAAIQTLSEAGFLAKTADLRLGMGKDLIALDKAGLLSDGAVYVMRQSDYVNAPVVRVDASGAAVIGRMSNDGFVAA